MWLQSRSQQTAGSPKVPLSAIFQGHLGRLPEGDEKSRAIVETMKVDEARHATSAIMHGAAELPQPAKDAMRLSSKVMTEAAFWL